MGQMSHLTKQFLFGEKVVGVMEPGLFGYIVPELQIEKEEDFIPHLLSFGRKREHKSMKGIGD
jgi:hypothetical protein